MEIVKKFKNKEEHIRYWCELLDKFYPMSSKELDITVFYIKKQLELKERDLPNEEIKAILISDSFRKSLEKSVGINNRLLNTYTCSLRKKKVIVNDMITSNLYPKDQLIFKFKQAIDETSKS